MGEPQQARLDHVAVGVRDLADAPPFLVGELGARFRNSGTGDGFTMSQWYFEHKSKLEVLAPHGPPGGFMHRFLDARGPGMHHATFLVPDLHAACARAQELGYRIVGFDESKPWWREAFLHPKEAHGIVVQMARHDPSQMPSFPRPEPPPVPEAAAPPARLWSMRLAFHDLEQADRQWAALLGGRPSRGPQGRRVYEFEGSPIRITVEADPARPEGPLCLELRCAPALALPEGPHPSLGARFVQVD